MSARLSQFAESLSVETAFTVLAVAKALKAGGKDVVELEIGDSPFDSTASAKSSGLDAIRDNQSHYCPSPGIPEFRTAAAAFVQGEFAIPAAADNVVAGPGAKVFEQFFCEAFLNPGDGVLVFSPFFPTYIPNIERRGARVVYSPLRQSQAFRPEISAIERFLSDDAQPKAIFLNSPHNPTGGVTTEQDLRDLNELARRSGQQEELSHWDLAFWAERLREQRFDYTDDELRPYFPMPRVLDGLFAITQRLFGVTIQAADGEAQVWHKDVRYFQVLDGNGEQVASFYLDPYSRPQDKRGGAWMNECLTRRVLRAGALCPWCISSAMVPRPFRTDRP